MKKLLLILGFLPVIAFANSTPRETLTQKLAEFINYAHAMNFTDDYYYRELNLYQTKYNNSDKNALCLQATQGLKKRLEFERQLNFSTIKNLIVKPSVDRLTDEQVQQILTEFNKGNFNKPKEVTKYLGELIEINVNQNSAMNGKNYTLNDLLINCHPLEK